jgi:putative phage-type endonuclease
MANSHVETDAAYLIDDPGLLAIPTRNMPREKWLELRRTGIGGSDIAAIMSQSPWRTPRDVYCDKAGLCAEKKPTTAMRFGKQMEPTLRRMTEQKLNFSHGSGSRVRVLPSPFVYRKVGQLIFLANIDGVVLAGQEEKFWLGLEIKTVNAHATKAWQNGAMPYHYLLQVNWYMGITNMHRWLMAPLLGGRLEIREVEFNEELWNDQQQAALGFWHTYVLPRRCPSPIPRKKSATPPAGKGNIYTNRGKLISRKAASYEVVEVY